MSLTLKVFSILALTTSSICTTAIVDKIVFSPLQNERYIEEDFGRSIKAHVVFFFIDGIATVSMLLVTAEMWIPFVIGFAAWVLSSLAYYYNNKIVNTMATVYLENRLRRTNTIRAILYFAKFVCHFAFCIKLYIE